MTRGPDKHQKRRIYPWLFPASLATGEWPKPKFIPASFSRPKELTMTILMLLPILLTGMTLISLEIVFPVGPSKSKIQNRQELLGEVSEGWSGTLKIKTTGQANNSGASMCWFKNGDDKEALRRRHCLASCTKSDHGEEKSHACKSKICLKKGSPGKVKSPSSTYE